MCRHDKSVSFSWDHQPTHRRLYCGYAPAITVEATDANCEENWHLRHVQYWDPVCIFLWSCALYEAMSNTCAVY